MTVVTSEQREEGDRRAGELLDAHLDEEQRREWLRTRSVTVVKRGPVRGLALRHGVLFFLAVAAATAFIALGHPEAAVLLVVVGLVFLPVLLPPALIAFSWRRKWKIDPDHGPRLLGRRGALEFCVRIEGDLPPADRVLAYKNILESNERHFLETANARRRWRGGRLGAEL